MTDFRDWERELGPEVTGIGKPSKDLNDEELEARLHTVEGELLGLELEEIESGRMTPDQVADEARQIRGIAEDEDED